MSGFPESYQEGEEVHDISCYQPLLNYVSQQPEWLRLVAGFLPHSMARLLVREGDEVA